MQLLKCMSDFFFGPGTCSAGAAFLNEASGITVSFLVHQRVIIRVQIDLFQYEQIWASGAS
jgi:hypothetical protein